MICFVCQTLVVGETFVVTYPAHDDVPEHKVHGECVQRVGFYQARGATVEQAIVLARRDVRGKQRRGY